MSTKIGVCLLLLLTGFPVMSVYAAGKKYAPEGSSTRAIQGLDDQIDVYILHPKTDEDRAFNAKLKHDIIHGIFDVEELCRLAMDKHWAELTPTDQASFVDLMTRLLEKKGIFSKEQSNRKGKAGQYFLTYAGDQALKADKSLSLVKTLVNIPSERLKIELNYKMKRSGDQWKMFDVIVDQASLLDNYRYQFDKIISKDGYKDLYRRMESKLQELEEKEKR